MDQDNFNQASKRKKTCVIDDIIFSCTCYCSFVRLEKECLDVLLHVQANVKELPLRRGDFGQ